MQKITGGGIADLIYQENYATASAPTSTIVMFPSQDLGVVLIHNTQSNNSPSNDAQFMHKLHLALHVMNRLTGDTIDNSSRKF